MGSPLASFSATRGWSVNVEPSLSFPVCGRPSAAGEAPPDSAGAAVAAALGAELGAELAAGVPLHAATSSEAAETIATAPREPIRMTSSSRRTLGTRNRRAGQYRFQFERLSTFLETFCTDGRGISAPPCPLDGPSPAS